MASNAFGGCGGNKVRLNEWEIALLYDRFTTALQLQNVGQPYDQ
jgi:hypothetical protein